MSFADLKKKSGSFEKLQTELEKVNNPVTSFADDRFWKPELDKSGNGYAIIRFLPQPSGEDLPWCKIWSHAFNGPGGWYIENSLTTLQNKDPVSEYNTELWNSGIEANKEIARKQKRRLNYTANVYVIKDPAHPENEGQVKFYRFGKKIFDKINDLMNPEFEDESPVNPFDLWEGANFKMKIRKIEGYSNYDKSEFEPQAPLLDGDDAKLEDIWKSEFSLKELVSTDKFKTFEELKIKLDKVLGLGTEDIPTAFSLPKDKTEDVPFDGGVPIKTTPKPAAESEDNDEEALGYFQKLAETA